MTEDLVDQRTTGVDPSGVDPAEIADRLPDRPLTPTEMGEIGDKIGWSALLEPYLTAEGTEYVPRAFFHDEPGQRAICLFMDDDLDEWSGEVVEENVDIETWMEVNQRYAETKGTEMDFEKITVEQEGEEVTIRDWRDGGE